MTDTREMKLGGRTFAVPATLPLRITRSLYPLCRKMSVKDGLTERVVAGGLMSGMTGEDMQDLATIATTLAQSAEPDVTQDELEALPITPVELFDAFWDVARFSTGMFVKSEAQPEAVSEDAAAHEETVAA
jgi:hypothetical protein